MKSSLHRWMDEAATLGGGGTPSEGGGLISEEPINADADGKMILTNLFR